MKINNILTKICILILIFSMASCHLLDTDPYDFVAPETFYKNESDCTMALAGIYYTMAKEHVYGNRYSCMLSNVDDLSYYSRKDQTNAVVANSHNVSNADLWYVWEALYDGINNANVLLDNVGRASISEEKVRARIAGEAKFLRAYYHFLLVQGWYEVPVRKVTADDINKGSLEATPHAEALDWIIQEMEECIEMVDDEKYDLSPSYVKKTVVEGILARVCLWRAGSSSNGGQTYYAKAAKYAKAVRDSGKHNLNPDVYALWKNIASDRYDKEYNESMLEVEFIGTRNDGSYTDSRIGNVIGNLQESADLVGAGYSYGFYSGSLLLWDLFEENDARRDLSMAPYKLNNKDEQVAWKEDQIVDRRCGKYRREWETNNPKNKNYTQINFCILRYADVLLMLAEAENEANQGPTALAYACINEVRSRAGIDAVSGLSYNEFQQLVRDERGRELCFEALRKYDLVRWGIYREAIHDRLGEATKDERWSAGNNYQGAAQYAAATGEKNQFMPIPSKELAVNTKLEQNKFWK